MKDTIAIIGLGYVGLPLAVEFGKLYEVIGFDIKKNRIAELKENYDRTLETTKEELSSARYLTFTSNLDEVRRANIFIVTVPTPIDKYKNPDLSPVISACHSVGKVLKKGDIVVFESTVYPGCTEEDCVPILEKESGLKFNTDFYCGYSPERINPGDKEHRLVTIKKVVSGSTPEIAKKINELYSSIIKAGTHLASSIKVAEAAKVIENSQRDINIAFVNELSLIFNKMGIDTLEVLEAAGTKWNFLPFKPGLVGGHCIGVDPYYLTYKAESVGYHSEVILSGRRINDNMGVFVAERVIKLLVKKDKPVKNARVLVLGITFKENCPDIRNSRVVDIINELRDFEINIDIYDPWADLHEVKEEYGFDLLSAETFKKEIPACYDAVVVAVSHDEFKNLDFRKFKNNNAVIFDIKGLLDKSLVDGRL